MSTESLTNRVAALEAEVARLRARLDGQQPGQPWWDRITGAFAADPIYAEAMKLGREYRQSLRGTGARRP